MVWVWVVLGLAVWVVLAVAVGLVVGAMIRRRDGEAPPPPVD